MADAEQTVKIMMQHGISARALQIILFLKVPRRPQTMIDELHIDRGTLNKIARKHPDYFSRRQVKDRHVSRGRGKEPIEYYLTQKGRKLVRMLES